MRACHFIYQHWLRQTFPNLMALLVRFLYEGRNIHIHRGFRCDGMPRIIIDNDAELRIGRNVLFRSGVEVRVHKTAKVIIEDDVRIDRGVRILATNKSVVRIGAGSRVGLYSILNGGASINIARSCLISGFVYLQTSMHRITNPNLDIVSQGYEHGEIFIDNGAWLGAHVVVMPGCKIGSRAVVGSNAVVTQDVDNNTIAAGVPARFLKRVT